MGLYALVLLMAVSPLCLAVEKQIKLEDIERDNLKSAEQARLRQQSPQPQFSFNAQPQPQQPQYVPQQQPEAYSFPQQEQQRYVLPQAAPQQPASLFQQPQITFGFPGLQYLQSGAAATNVQPQHVPAAQFQSLSQQPALANYQLLQAAPQPQQYQAIAAPQQYQAVAQQEVPQQQTYQHIPQSSLVSSQQAASLPTANLDIAQLLQSSQAHLNQHQARLQPQPQYQQVQVPDLSQYQQQQQQVQYQYQTPGQPTYSQEPESPKQQPQQQQQFVYQQPSLAAYNSLLQQQQQQKFSAGAKSTPTPPVKPSPQASGGFVPSSTQNAASFAHPNRGVSFNTFRRFRGF